MISIQLLKRTYDTSIRNFKKGNSIFELARDVEYIYKLNNIRIIIIIGPSNVLNALTQKMRGGTILQETMKLKNFGQKVAADLPLFKNA